MKKKKKLLITKVNKNSIADEVGITKGDKLLSINGKHITDILDYLFLTSDEYIELEIEISGTNEIVIYEIEKEYDEDVGIKFSDPLLDDAKHCNNNCIFCFIDQLPKGLRTPLYFKDDDSRLSFMQGNFVTLTNVNYEQLDRIVRYRISPINISVHASDPDLRISILRNRFAGDIIKKMKILADGNIDMNAQIVLMPGINDGIHLEKTIEDLSKLYPHVNSVAIVPIGISKFRDDLYPLRPFIKSESQKLIEQMRKIQFKMINSFKTRFAFLSDEFYLLANSEIPDSEFYEEYIQLENGIGLIRKFYDEISQNIHLYINKVENKYLILTGTLANDWMNKIVDEFKLENFYIKTIKNDFFGETITVSGLITGTDIINQIGDLSSYNGIIIPDVMLKADEDIFLDDIKIEDLQEKIGMKIYKVAVDGKEFLKLLEELE